MIAQYKKYKLQFKRTAKTSRGEYKTRPVWYLFLSENGKTGIGECAPLSGLSTETPEQVENLLDKICSNPELYIENPERTKSISSVHFAMETALLDLRNGGKQILFPAEFSEGKQGIPINGLIWMGDEDFMQQQIQEKLDADFHCIKLKIGGINFDKEIEMLKSIRQNYNGEKIILRLDANGAFKVEEAVEKLAQLAPHQIHSIEQPIATGKWNEMKQLCSESPIPIALDEELIGIHSFKEKQKMLDTIQPQFLVLKPSLHGGFSGCNEWIELAEQRKIGWWITSYLESNIGLNAIAQWAFHKNAQGYQGLGTGWLFTNNIDSPLEIRGEQLWINSEKTFQFPENFIEI